jgi:hypothetical protein
MKFVLLLSIIALFTAGCSGDAKVTIYNDTNTEARGDVDGNSFSIEPYGAVTKKVEVGDFFKKTSDITLTTRACCSDYYGNCRCRTFVEEMEMEKDNTYYYYVYCDYAGTSKPTAEPEMELQMIEPNSNIVAP